MFVITYNNNVILGPMRWNRFRFENEIQEECEVSVTLENRNDEMVPVIVSNEIKILPVQGTPEPNYNSKIQFLNGPFWQFTDTHAIMSYRPEYLSIEAVKNTLKEKTAAERWKKENAGVTVSLNGVEYKFSTSKENRALLQSLVSTGANWKFDRDTWVQFTSAQIQVILNSVLSYVQECFAWEFYKIAEIDQCTTLQQLDAIVIAEPESVGVI